MTNPVDLPDQDGEITSHPVEILRDLAEAGKNNLFFLASGILGYKDLTRGAHEALCNFASDNPAKIKLILMPRDHFKTTVVTISGSIQRVIRDPNKTNLIVNESATNAQRFLRAIKLHAETNKRFRAIYSHLIPRDTTKGGWNDNELIFNRTATVPEPTLDTVGMTGAMTSRHYNHITFDDPISEEAIASEKVMQDAINRIKAQQALLVKPTEDTITYVGTRWAFYDVYSWLQKTYRLRLRKFIRAAVENGKIIFPERFTPEILAEMREALGEYKYSCLMMNNPRDESRQDFNVADLRWWGWADKDETKVELFDRSGNVLDTWDLDQLDITLAVDPAPAETTDSDRNAVVVTGVSPKAQAIVLDAWGERCTPHKLIQHLLWCKKRWNPRVFGVEGVAYQKTLKYFLMQHGLDSGMYLNIEELSATGKNHKVRQIRSLQPVAAVGRLYLHPTQHILRDELSEFPLGEHDDVLDALSMNTRLWHGHLSMESVERSKKLRDRMTRLITSGYRGDQLLLGDGSVQRAVVGGPRFEPDDMDDEVQRYGEIQEYTFR